MTKEADEQLTLFDRSDYCYDELDDFGPALCADCAVDVHAIHEWYMVHDDVWAAAVLQPRLHRFLCVACLETRLGRDLTPADFSDCICNVLAAARSPRLRHRLGAGHLDGDDLLAWIDAALDRIVTKQANAATYLLALHLAAGTALDDHRQDQESDCASGEPIRSALDVGAAPKGARALGDRRRGPKRAIVADGTGPCVNTNRPLTNHPETSKEARCERP